MYNCRNILQHFILIILLRAPSSSLRWLQTNCNKSHFYKDNETAFIIAVVEVVQQSNNNKHCLGGIKYINIIPI